MVTLVFFLIFSIFPDFFLAFRSMKTMQYELLPNHRLRFQPASLTWVASKPVLVRSLASDPAQSIAKCIQRLGRAVLSKEMIHAMLGKAETPAYALAVGMHDLASTPSRIARASSVLRSCADIVPWSRRVQFRYPLHMMAWRVDTPSRILAFTGTDTDVGGFMARDLAPHKLSKVILNERSQRPDPSRVELTEYPVTASVRESVRSWASRNLDEGFREQIKHSEEGMQAHTLEEAIACFVTRPVVNHTQIKINENKQWSKDEIDPR